MTSWRRRHSVSGTTPSLRRFRFCAAPGPLFGDEGVSGFRFPRPDRHIDRESVAYSLPPRLSLDKLACKLACRAFEADSKTLVQDAPLGAVLPGDGGEPDATEVRLGPAIIDHRPDPARIRIDPVRERHVGGILLHFAHVWAEHDCLPWVVKVLAEGYRPKFRLVPPLTRQPPLFGRLQSPKREARLDLVRAMLEKEAIEPDQDVSSPGFYSLLFLVPKVTEVWRPVIDRSVHSKSLFRHSNVLHGNCGTDSGMPPVGSVGYVSRPKGCLFPHSSPPLVPEIYPISNRGRVVSVSRSSLRDFHSSVVIHQSGLGGEEDSASLGNTTFSVPRRLANPGLVCQRLSPAHRDCPSPVPGPGTCGEQG